jgi:hypothetical protein
LNSWVWLHRVCILEEAKADATTVACCLHGSPPAEILSQAQAAAAGTLRDVLQSAEDPAQIKANLEAECIATERKELWALKSLYELRSTYEFPSERLRRDAKRLEGVIVFLEFLESKDATQSPPEITALVRNASGLLADVQSELQKLEILKPRFEEALVVLHTARMMKQVLTALPRNPQSAVTVVQRKHAGLLAPAKNVESSAAQASIVSEAQQDAEARWRRCEGGLIAVKALAHGSILRCELWLHQAHQVRRGSNLGEVKSYLVGPEPAMAEDQAKPGVSVYRQHQVLENLLKSLGESDTNPGGEPPQTGDLDSLLTEFKSKELETYEPQEVAPSAASVPPVEDVAADPAPVESDVAEADPGAAVPAAEEATTDADAQAEAEPEVTLGQYREDRFEERAREAAGAVVRALLSDGLHAAVFVPRR